MGRELQILLLMLVTGALLGFFSARWAADHSVLSGAVRAGSWQAWPNAGVEDATPYARLRYYLDDALPPSPMDRLELLAEEDDEGNRLDTACAYELKGPMLPVRTWILGVHRLGEHAAATADLHAEQAIYEPDGTLLIHLAPRPWPGNWLPMPRQGNGRVRLVLQLFGISPLERERILKRNPFAIHRKRCS